MNENFQKILVDALKLPPMDRMQLIEALMTSFDLSQDPEIMAAWAEEAEARLHAYEQGEIQAIPAEEVFDFLNRRRLA